MKLYRHIVTRQAARKPYTPDPIPTTAGAATLPAPYPLIRVATIFATVALIGLTLYLVASLYSHHGLDGSWQLITQTLSSHLFWSAVAVGFLAQAIDGALGMAYGITSTTFLLGAGASPAMASASVHIAEVFTTGVSGIAHARLGNVDRQLFLRLLLPGISGALLGALVVTQVDGQAMKPFVAIYLLIMGLYILRKACQALRPATGPLRHVGKLALLGGFVDAAGGGGWGPVVTTSLLGSGNPPRTTIGSVNFAEFFLALASAASFALMVGSGVWVLVAGLVIGGLFAAPFAALMTRRLKARSLMLLVGSLISLLSLYNLYQALLVP